MGRLEQLRDPRSWRRAPVLVRRFRQEPGTANLRRFDPLVEAVLSNRVVFAETVPATIDAIRAASAKTLVLWSFYSPDFAAFSEALPSRFRPLTPAGTSPPSAGARQV